MTTIYLKCKLMKKRILLFIIITVLMLTSVSVFSFAEQKSAVEIKLQKLKEVYPTGSYFTKSGTAVGEDDWSNVSSTQADSQLASIPSRGGLPAGSEVGRLGTSCFAFAIYCFYYIFGHDFYENVTKTNTYSVGDAIFFWYSGGSAPSHYGIYLGEDDENYYIYDANWNHDCAVREYGRVRKSKYAYVSVYHANGYDGLTAEDNLSDLHTVSVGGKNHTVIKKGDSFTLDASVENDGYNLLGFNLINSRGERVNEAPILHGQEVVFDENILKYPSDTLNFVAIWDKAHEFSEFVSDGNAQLGVDGTKTRVCSECGHTETVTDTGSRLLYDTTAVFDDVEALWYKNAIDYCYTYKLFAGVEQTHFGVSDNVTRGMYVTVLARIAGVEPDENAVTDFLDVQTGRYYTYAIAWAKKNGIVAGMSDTEFWPDSPITRAQLCVMTVNFAKFMKINVESENKPIEFLDGDSIPKWAKAEVDICTRLGIVSGYTEGEGAVFKQGNTATRVESAQILYKFYKDYVIINADSK